MELSHNWSRPARVLAATLLISLGFVLAACGSGGSGDAAQENPSAVAATSTPEAVSQPTEAELIAVAETVFPVVQGQLAVGLCAYNEQMDACPFTERLKTRLNEERVTICRCQNPSATREITVERGAEGGIAHVLLYEGTVTMDLVIVQVDGELLVDDNVCHGRPETSVYAGPIGPC